MEIFTKKLTEDSPAEPHHTYYWLQESKRSEETQVCTHPRSADGQLTSEEENQITKKSPREPDTPATIVSKTPTQQNQESRESSIIMFNCLEIASNNYF